MVTRELFIVRYDSSQMGLLVLAENKNMSLLCSSETCAVFTPARANKYINNSGRSPRFWKKHKRHIWEKHKNALLSAYTGADKQNISSGNRLRFLVFFYLRASKPPKKKHSILPEPPKQFSFFLPQSLTAIKKNKQL